MDDYAFYILFACQVLVFLVFVCRKISSEEIEGCPTAQGMLCFLVYPAFISCSIDANTSQNWLFFEIASPLLAISVSLVILTFILYIKYKKTFVTDNKEDQYSLSLKNLCIPDEEIKSLRRILRHEENPSNPSQEMQHGKTSALNKKIESHDEACEDLLKKWVLIHEYKKEIYILTLSKEIRERNEEFSSFFPEKRKELQQEKEDILKNIRLLMEEEKKISYFASLKEKENELQKEISSLQSLFFSVSIPQDSQELKDRYEALKSSFLACKEEYLSSKEKLHSNPPTKDTDLSKLFPTFFLKKEQFLQELKSYQSFENEIQRNYETMSSYLQKPSLKELSFAKELTSSKNRHLRELGLTYLSLLYEVSAKSPSFKPLICQKEFYEDVIQRTLKEEDMSSFLKELLASMKQSKLADNLIELDYVRKEITDALIHSSDLEKLLVFLVLTKNYSEPERLNDEKPHLFLLSKDKDGNNFLHQLYSMDSSFAITYIKYTQNPKVKELLLQANNDYLYPLDFLPFLDSKAYIQPGIEERRYTVSIDSRNLPLNFKKQVLIRFYANKAKNTKLPPSEREKARQELINIEEIQTNPIFFDSRYLLLMSEFLEKYLPLTRQAFLEFSRFEKYLPSFLTYDQIKEDMDYLVHSLQFDLFQKYMSLIPHLYLFIPSYNIRSFFAGKPGPECKDKDISVRNIEYIMQCLISLKKNFFDKDRALPFLTKLKDNYLVLAKQIYSKHPSEELYEEIVLFDPHF